MARTKRDTPAPDPEARTCHRGTHSLYWRAIIGRISRCEHVPCRVVEVDADGWVTLDVDGGRVTGWNHDPDGLRAESAADRRNAHVLADDLVMVGSHAYLLLDEPSPCSYVEPETYREWCAARGIELPDLDDDDWDDD